MREILFRGKATNREPGRAYRTKYKNGDWVYGLLTDVDNYAGFSEMTNTNGVSGIDVDKNTVGQFTGLFDKDGKKIFEGDIVRYVNPDEDAITGSVVYGEHTYVGTHEIGFYVAWKIPEFAMYLRNDLGFWTKCREIEVIGNIHDNPELLEE